MALDLKALLAQARVESRIKSPSGAINARLTQRSLAEQRAHEYARDLEKRHTLSRALSSDGIDAMRFRWLGDHPVHWQQLSGLGLDELRKQVDLLIKQEAIRCLSEMRRKGAA